MGGGNLINVRKRIDRTLELHNWYNNQSNTKATYEVFITRIARHGQTKENAVKPNLYIGLASLKTTIIRYLDSEDSKKFNQ